MTKFAIKKAFTSKKVGGSEQPHAPNLGENYRLAVEYTVKGTPKHSYPIRFTMAGLRIFVTPPDLTPGTKTVACNFGQLPLDGAIPWAIEIDPYGFADSEGPPKSPIKPKLPPPFDEGGGTVSPKKPKAALKAVRRTGSFDPTPPADAIEYLNPKWAIGRQRRRLEFTPGTSVDRVALMMGSTTSESWQTALFSRCRITADGESDVVSPHPVENGSAYPVHFWDSTDPSAEEISAVLEFSIKLQNVRVNASQLRLVTWSDLAHLSTAPALSFYRQPESVIESDHPDIKDFVIQVLGAKFRSQMTPYDAARQMFQAVLARTKYFYPAAGQQDLRGHTALQTLHGGLGDCGSFSLLLVAIYRHLGFAARTAAGAWLDDGSHCWSEMWFPPFGWVHSDGAAGNGESESGKYAFYFGNAFNLNTRFAIMRGNTFNVQDVKTAWLQGPHVLVSEGATYDSTDETISAPVTQAEAEAFTGFKKKSPPPKPYPQMPGKSQPKHGCPCSHHGGSGLLRRPLLKGGTPKHMIVVP